MTTMQVPLVTTMSIRQTIRTDELKMEAKHLVRAALCLTIRDRLVDAAQSDWEIGTELLDNDEPRQQEMGVLYLLRVLASVPNNAQGVARHLLSRLNIGGEVPEAAWCSLVR